MQDVQQVLALRVCLYHILGAPSVLQYRIRRGLCGVLALEKVASSPCRSSLFRPPRGCVPTARGLHLHALPTCS